MARNQDKTSTGQVGRKRGPSRESPIASSFVASMFVEELRSFCRVPNGINLELSDESAFSTRGANETRQLASYSNSTRSKLDSSELESSSSSTRNVNESSRATRNSTRKAREKLKNILYIKF